jgi:hypothetical protein
MEHGEGWSGGGESCALPNEMMPNEVMPNEVMVEWRLGSNELLYGECRIDF